MKSKIKVDRILYPKSCYKTTAGEFSIFTAVVLKHIEGEEPVKNKIYNTITLKGNVPAMGNGDEFIITYDEPETTQYGTSYKLNTISKEVDKTDKKQVYEYLKFLAGSKIADELIKLDNPLGLIENRQDELLLQVKGVGEKVLEKIYANASTSLDFSYAFSELLPFGLTKVIIGNICRELGSAQTAVQMCKNNPYALVKKVKGISFIKADEIAMKCGLDMTSNERLECAIYHILAEGGANGKTYMTSAQVMSELSKLNLINWLQVNQVIMQMEKEGKLVLVNNGTEVALTYYFNLEQDISNQIKRLRDAETHIKVREDWMDIVRAIEEEQGWEHTDEQLEGIKTVLENNVVIVTGYGGTGKSTITNAMTSILQDYEIQQTCLSAKASQRLEECSGLPAKTIHRLLGLGLDGVFKEVEEIYTDILIIDEGSMVNGTLFRKILKALKDGTKLIIAGDTGQLQAIGDCSVLSDLINSGAVPVVHLTKIHRQAQKSAIITKSIDCRHQRPLYDKDFRGHMVMGELQDLEIFIEDEKENLMALIVRKFKSLLEQGKDINEIQIICPTKTRGAVSCDKINYAIQSLYNPKIGESYTLPSGAMIYKGDKVINLKNNYKATTPTGEKVGIYNGNMGIVTKVTKNSIIVQFQEVEIEFKNKERDALGLGYCISVHSSQGSQWADVICAFSSDAYTLLNVEILYTAISRAGEHCTIVAEHQAINIALRNVEGNTKQTYLTKFISET